MERSSRKFVAQRRLWSSMTECSVASVYGCHWFSEGLLTTSSVWMWYRYVSGSTEGTLSCVGKHISTISRTGAEPSGGTPRGTGMSVPHALLTPLGVPGAALGFGVCAAAASGHASIAETTSHLDNLHMEKQILSVQTYQVYRHLDDGGPAMDGRQNHESTDCGIGILRNGLVE